MSTEVARRGALPRLAVGLDFGTSGARICVIDRRERSLFETGLRYAAPRAQDASDWEAALLELLASVPAELRRELRVLSLCATSGSVLWADRQLRPLGPVLMYHDARAADLLRRLRQRRDGEAAQTPLDALARLAWLAAELGEATGHALPMHQSDWLLARLLPAAYRRRPASDWHNALKTGADAAGCAWGTVARSQPFAARLPRLVAPGSLLGRVDPQLARSLGLPPALRLRAGTTDSNAAFLASGARAGDALSTLGSTLSLKLLSPRRIDRADYGVYSHRFGAQWLVSGASNAGGAVLRQLFDDARLRELSLRIDAEADSPLDLYPLPAPGERFPVADPRLAPRLDPRPADDALYLHGLLQALARIEAAGYARLHELGAPAPSRVLGSGGGAANPAWTRLRQRALGLPVLTAPRTEAAYGAARLALLGGAVFGRPAAP